MGKRLEAEAPRMCGLLVLINAPTRDLTTTPAHMQAGGGGLGPSFSTLQNVKTRLRFEFRFLSAQNFHGECITWLGDCSMPSAAQDEGDGEGVGKQ